jgi:hypothetical protein
MPAKSREHRIRVLEHQAKIAAEGATEAGAQRDRQLKMPLIVEVRAGEVKKQRSRRGRRAADGDQLGLDDM